MLSSRASRAEILQPVSDIARDDSMGYYGIASLQQTLGSFRPFLRRIDYSVESDVLEFLRNKK